MLHSLNDHFMYVPWFSSSLELLLDSVLTGLGVSVALLLSSIIKVRKEMSTENYTKLLPRNYRNVGVRCLCVMCIDFEHINLVQ